MKRDIDKFHLMKVFQAVAVKGSFTKAAKELKMTLSSVSKSVQQLESSLQTKLLHRTTRSQSLTDSGRQYLTSADRILSDFRELEERLLHQNNEPSGQLRITAATALGQFLIAPRMHEFLEKYPQLEIDLILDEKLIDITEEGFDVAIRSLDVSKMSSLYSTKVGSNAKKLVASPTYLSQITIPNTPEQLNKLNLLNYPRTKVFSYWNFSKGKQELTIDPKAIYTSNNFYALYKAALNGMGIANLHDYMVDEEIKNGNLVEILPDWKQTNRDIYAVFQQRKDTSPKIDAFLNFARGLFD